MQILVWCGENYTLLTFLDPCCLCNSPVTPFILWYVPWGMSMYKVGWLNSSSVCGGWEAGGSWGWSTGSYGGTAASSSLQHPPPHLPHPPIPVYIDFAWKQNELLWWWQQGLEQPHVAVNRPCRLLHSRVALLLKTAGRGELVCYKLNCWTDLKGLSSCQFILWDFTCLMYSEKKAS